MPKRIPTPPPADDEPRYLTVVHPFAISGHCNMELPKDRIDFARWVACCIDKDAFFAFFHKPSARDMVIIEVSRDYQHFDRILGEHRWSEFLRNPEEDEKDRITQVFYCTYNTGRIVQKNGWKRINVVEGWFQGWSTNNSVIASPYPATHFCEVPVEDQTNHPLCRPLPGAVKTPPLEIAAPQPVVGSTEWIQTKQDSSKARSAWAKGPPKTGTTTKGSATANGSVKKVVNVSRGLPPGVRMPAVGGGPITVKSANVWRNDGKGGNSTALPVVVNWDDSPSASGQQTPAVRATSPGAPPGLSISKDTKPNAWGNSKGSGSSTSTSTAPQPFSPPGLSVSSVMPNRSTSATSWGDSSPDSESGADNLNSTTTTTSNDEPFRVHTHFSEAMEEEFHGLKIREFGEYDDDDDDDPTGLDSMAPRIMWEPTATGDGAGCDDGDGADFDDIDAGDAEEYYNQTQAANSVWATVSGNGTDAAKKPLCNAHGVICKKGICAEYARQLRLAKREEEAKERKEEMKKKAAKKEDKRKARAAEKNVAVATAKASTQVQTPVQVKNSFRGTGGPVKTNWRGAPRAIVTADDIEKREAVHKEVKALGEEDDEDAPRAASVVNTSVKSGPTSDAGWNVSEASYNPWGINLGATETKATTDAPVPVQGQGRGQGGKRGRGQQQKKQQQQPRQQQQKSQKNGPQAKQSQSWADQVEAASAAGWARTSGDDDGDGFSVVGSKGKRGPRIGSAAKTSANGWGVVGGAADVKSSTSGWGSVPEMPW